MGVAARAVAGGLTLLLCLATLSCGGGSTPAASGSSGGGPPPAASNVAAVVVDEGPLSTTSPTVNILYASVTVCVPGSTTACQTIDHIQVDTGSTGLRILAPVLTLSLPVTMASDGNSLAECTQFVDGYSWGPVASADIQISGESASSVPVQVIGTAGFAAVPAGCSSTNPNPEDTVAAFGANGILGIGVFEQDCGADCATNADNSFYYSCSSTACVPIAATLSTQVLNPVPLFPTDNNGTIIDLPSVAGSGAATVSGSLIFGIDTQSNNESGTQTVLTVEPASAPAPLMPGDLTVVFNGTSLGDSFIDSGTNGIFFNDSAIPVCASPNAGFYCPTGTLNLTATLVGVNSISATADFSIANAETLFANPTYAAYSTLGGIYTSSTTTFDFGLPFYFGRRVATAIESHTTSAGTGPYVAF